MAKNKTINMVKSQVIYKDYSKDAERTALVSGENLSHMFGKIARWYTDISWVGHTHTEANITDFGTYAGASTKGGAATSANKLNIGSADIGSETKPVYFSYLTGKPVACTYSLNASVPANAVFTDINVKQSPSTANESREVLFAGNTGNTETTGTVGKSNKLYFNPSTGALTATSFSGSIAASNLTGTIDAGRLPTTSVTAGSYGPAAGGTLTYGGTFDVPYVTVDKYGRLTVGSTKTFTMPAQYTHPTYTSKTSGLYKITVDGTGHVSGTAAVTASDLPAHTHNYVSSSGITSTTEVQINPTGSSYNEGLRIGKASNGWSNINFGCSNSTTAGTQSGQWSVGVRGAVGATAGGIGDFIIEHNGASGNGLTLYTDGSTPRWNNVEFSMSGHTHPYLPESTVTGSPDLDTYLTSGVYHIKTQASEHAPTTNHATLFVDGTVGTPYQLFIPDVSTGIWYSRYKSGTSAWSSWLSLKMTDTVYTHPTYTSKASGLYKITVDGTGHVSATAAVAAADLPSHTHAYLPLSGGTMTGAITFQVADAIKYNAANATYTMISFLTGDGNGHGISIGGGGLTVLGSGESASALISALSLAATNETTYIASDNNIEFYSYCQTIGNRLGLVFDTSGRLRPNTNNTRTLGGTDYYWNKAYIRLIYGGSNGSWISGRDNAVVINNTVPAGDSYAPVIAVKTNLGSWTVGSLGSSSKTTEHLYFSYTTDANYNAGTNASSNYYLSSSGWFSGTAAKADKWSTARTITIGSTGKSVDGSGNVSWSLSEIGAAASSHSHSNYLPQTMVSDTPDLNTYDTTGVYHISKSSTNAPVTQHSTLYVEANVGTHYQLFKPDNVDTVWYTRHKITGGWSDWVALKLTDTVYTHPTYTSKTSGLYKITVDGTGHVSATAAVAAADLPSHTHAYIPLAGSTDVTGEIVTTSANGFRLVYNKYGAIIRNDGEYWWFLITAKQETDAAAKTATWANTTSLVNNTHPLRIALSNGRVYINGYTIDKSVPSNAVFTDNNTTYTIATGDSNGQIKVTPSSGSAYNVSVKGLGSAAYTASTAYAAASHTHSYLPKSTVTGSPDLNTYKTSGIYTIKTTTATHSATNSYHTTLFVDGDIGTPYQILKPDADDTTWYTRHINSSTGAWTSWVTLNLADNKLGAISANGYWGMATKDGADNDWIRTTSLGLIPYQSGGLNAGHQSIGTSAWYFSHAYIDNFHGCTLALGGSAVQGKIDIQSTTTASVSYNSTNPRIRFMNSNGSQNIDIIMSDYDSVRAPAALSVHGNQGGEYLLAPNISAWDYTNNKLMAMLSAWSLGTTSAVGQGRVIAGNSIKKGTAGNARGYIEIYSEQDGCAFLVAPSTITTAQSGYVVTLPSSAGTLALVGDNNHTHTYIESKANYTFTSSTLPNSFDWGVSAGFVNSDSGFGSFGSVLTVRTYSGGGGTLQLYAPYSSTYGGTHLKARFGNYASSSGNSWTSLRELAWNDEKLGITTVTGSPDLDTYLTTGIYTINTSSAVHSPTTNYSTLFVDGSVGTPFQVLKPDANDTTWYTRHRNNSAGTWGSWVALTMNGIPNTADGLSGAINLLSTGSSYPTDNDYYVTQYAGGGTSTVSYHRRPHSALWEYIRQKISNSGGFLGHTQIFSGSTAIASGKEKTIVTVTTDSGSQDARTYFVIRISWSSPSSDVTFIVPKKYNTWVNGVFAVNPGGGAPGTYNACVGIGVYFNRNSTGNNFKISFNTNTAFTLLRVDEYYC